MLYKKKYLELALDLCTKSIELLRDASRLYYFVELLEYRKEIVTRLLEYKLKESRKTELKTMYDKDCEWEILFKELYTEYDVPVYMQNFTYFYVETECNSAVEVIRTRRNMVKLSRAKVSDNICTEKTVERFENYTHSPSIVIIRDIFERIRLCAEYKRARVITDNAEMLEVANELIKKLNAWDSTGVTECLDILVDNLHMDIPYNMQMVKRYRNLIDIREKNDENENLYKAALTALECTIPFAAVIRKEDIYLERAELFCTYDLAYKVEGEVSATCRKIIEKICFELLNQKVEPARLCVVEVLATELASYYGDMGRYEDSAQLSKKLLKECLTHRRLVALINNIYNILWNYEKSTKCNNDVCDNKFLKTELIKCLFLSQLERKDNWQTFLQQKINTLTIY